MRLATIRTGDRTTAVRVEDDHAVALPADDVGQVLQRPDWREWAADQAGESLGLAHLDYAPLVLNPSKIICVGLNYRKHIEETGSQVPAFPTLFAKYTCALIGAFDDIALPVESESLDWEAELAVIIGRPCRRVSKEQATHYIAGLSVLNDLSARDFQRRTSEWLQGKTFEGSTPLGPWLVTDEDPAAHRAISCLVDDEVMQDADAADLVFGPAALVSYISTIVTLQPGDVIATGTPGGVGWARQPPRFLQEGDTVVTRIEGVGEARNRCRRDATLTQ